MNGILLIDKPKGWTSFDAVNRVRGMVQSSPLNQSAKKRFPAGHSGTLDPLATGLLVLALGDHTKRVPELTGLDKTYVVTMTLGTTSTTLDAEGELTVTERRLPLERQVGETLLRFKGTQQQVPPVLSAIKVNGRRAYQLARAGKAVEMTPRQIHVRHIALDGCDGPIIRFTCRVSSGTYIRSLVRDIGEELGCGAYMSDLRRTSVGDFELTEAVPVEGLTLEHIARNTFRLPSPDAP